MSTTEDPLVETWQIHNRINLYLLDAIHDEALGATLNGKGPVRSCPERAVNPLPTNNLS